MHFSRIIFKSALMASALAAPISTSVNVDAGSAVGSVKSTAQGFISIAGSDAAELIPKVAERALPDVGAAVGSAQSLGQGVASKVPGYAAVESTAQGAAANAVGAVSGTDALSTVEGLVRRSLDVLDLSSTLGTVQSTAGGVVSEVEGVAGVDNVVSGAQGLTGSVGSTASGAVSRVGGVAKRVFSGLDKPVDTVESTAGSVITAVEDKVDGVVSTAEGAIA